MVSPITITNTFNGDISAANYVNAAALDTQLTNLATTINSEIAERQRTVRDGSGLASQVVRFSSLHPEVTAALTAGGLVPKQAATVVSLINVVSLSGLQVIDGYTLLANDRVLLVGQSNPINNGLWTASAGAWTRPSDSSANAILPLYTFVNILNGSSQIGSSWYLSSISTVGLSAQTWVIYASRSSASSSSGGSGLGVSVKSFGASGNGLVDDTSAIQATIDAVNIAGGGVVYFPAGTYLISIVQVASATFKHALTIYPGIVLRGESRERSVIKLKPGAGNYNAIISRALATDADMNDFGMYDLCIDQNNTGNVPTVFGDLTNAGNSRYAVLCFGGHRISVKNCWFKDYKSINTISTNAPVGLCTDVQITGNWFDHASSATIANDHSAIYTNASEVVIAYNRFRSPAKNTFGATTAIEVHGSQQSVYGNVITNYLIGCNLTGVAYRTDGVSFVNNIIEGGRYGVQLWSWFADGNTTQAALTNCTVSGNSIRLDRDPWTFSLQISFGISTDQVGTAPCESIAIKNNIIHWEPTTVNPSSGDQYSVGIGWERSAIGGVGYDQDITISGNIIIGAPANGIRVFAPIRRLTIENNTIKNCGQSVNGSLVAAYRAGIFAWSPSTLKQWIVRENHLVDDQATPTMTSGCSAGSSVTVTACRFEDNVWNVGAGHTYPFFAGSYFTGAGWYVRQAVDVYSVTVQGLLRTGSEILETSTGTNNKQVTTPEGVTFVPIIARLYNQYQIPWGQASGLGALDASADLTAQFSSAANLIIGGTLPGIGWFRGPANTARGMAWYTGASSQRWGFFTNTAESGSNVGSDLTLFSYDDAGAFVDTSMVWSRAAGKPFFWYRPMAIESGFSPAQLIVTAATYPLLANNIWVTFTGTAQCVMTAPSASVYGSGRPWVQWVKNRTTSGVSILYRRSGADTIDGSTDDVVINPGETAMFVGNGTSDILVVERSGGDTSRIATRTLRAVNLNNAGVDAATAVRLPSNYRVRKVTVTNASISLTTATFSLRTAAAGAGTAIVSAAGLAALTTNAKVTEPAIAVTDRQSATTLYLRNDTAQGAAATADFIIEFEDLR